MSIQVSLDTRDKIKTLSELAATIAGLKEEGRCVVHCHGMFDLVHPGHIRHLAAAKREGDILVVTITPDRFANKGPHLPAFSEELRAENLASLQHVDFVAVNESSSIADAIRLLKPDVFAKGNGHSTTQSNGHIDEAVTAAQAVGARMHLTNDIIFSSTKLLNSFLPVYPPDVHDYLRDFRTRYTFSDLAKMVDSFKNLRVMVVGEAILDEYVYGDVLGKSAKEPILAMRYLSKEVHAGGSVVIANHLADFVRALELVTYLGAEDTREDFIRDCLKENVNPTFVYKPGSPTIVKRRFVEKYLVTKLLEIYHMNDEPLTGDGRECTLRCSGKPPACLRCRDYG